MKEENISNIAVFLIVIVSALMLFNQLQIANVNSLVGFTGFSVKTAFLSGSAKSIVSKNGADDLSKVDISSIKSTAQAISALFPIDKIKIEQDAIDIMIPTGVPDYGEAMGVTFEDPVTSMNLMAKSYNAIKQQAQQDPELWKRYLNLAAAPRGISCEFCCGVGAQGIDSNGNLKCGCQHNPAVQALTIWLMQNTEYSDAQILKEVMKWKTLWFPRDMVALAVKIAGGDASVLKDLPGMVGGC